MDDGIITDSKDIEYFKSDEYRNVIKEHMIREEDKHHLIYFLNDGIGIRVNTYRPSYKPTEEPTIKQIKSDDLTEQEQKIVNYLKQYGFIRRSTVEDILDVGNTRAKHIITSLIEKDIVMSEGKGPSVKYKLK